MVFIGGNAIRTIGLTFLFALATGAYTPARAIPYSNAPAKSVTGAASPNDDDQTLPLIVMADFNHDGIADIAEAIAPKDHASGPRLLEILLGRADGSSQPSPSRLPLGHDPRSIVAGDFNKDGFLDLVVGDGDGTLIEFFGDGNGNFAPATEIAHAGSVESIAAGDFNHDGVLDMAVSDSRANTATILLGNGNGTFRTEWGFQLPIAGDIYHLAVADFNGDGIPDLAVTNEDQDSFDVLLGNGNGTFTYTPALSNIKDPNAHCVT